MAAKVKPINIAPGKARIAQGDRMRPSAAMTTMKPRAYNVPRIKAQVTSPRATSATPSGVARMAS